MASDPWRSANTPLLAASIALMTLSIVGTRVVFAMPLDLRANWIFRVTGVRGSSKMLAATRRSLWVFSALPVWLATAAFCLRLWPWRQAAGHLILLALIGLLLTDICLLGFRKFPFACSYLPGKSQINMVVLGALGLLYFVTLSVKIEQQLLQDPRTTALMLTPFAFAALGLRIWTAAANSGEGEDNLKFEEERPPAIQELGIRA